MKSLGEEMAASLAKFLVAVALAMPFAVESNVAAAADYSAEAAATKAYALKALETYRSLGAEAAVKDFMIPDKWFSSQYSLHVTVVKSDSTVLADSGFRELVGLKWNDVDDLDGVPLGPTVAAAVAKSPTGAVLQFRFTEPQSKLAGHAEGYCMKVEPDNILCGWTEVVLR